jgi:NADH-quinone oxidoreductase subunit G
MADPVKFTIDGRELEAPAGTLVIEAAKRAGIEIPSFCYYEGLSLQAACRMCLVEVEKMPKLQVACTLPVGAGMVIHTDSAPVRTARKYTLEFLLTNHPLDCPVCDKGGECELQDMVFRYGAGESRFTENKIHVDEQQWSPVVFYDGPRCILCFRCVRACDEGMGVGALGVINRGAVSLIAPNKGDHLECDECGQCIDICPVGALTSGAYRYKTRPWEMEHVGTTCTHCADGCKTTLGVRNEQIIRGNNRDRSGINGEFLCVKGRYAFDFIEHADRLQSPMVRNAAGKLEEVSWSKALEVIAKRFNEIGERNGRFGIIASNRTTNEENFYLQKFARQCLGTNNIDHERSGDVTSLVDALSGTTGRLAGINDFQNGKAALIIGADLSAEHPHLAFQLRTNNRLRGAHVYVVSAESVREDNVATRAIRAARGTELDALGQLRDALAAEPDLTIVFGDSIKGSDVRRLVEFGQSLGNAVSYCALVDYVNSRGAIDMGLAPELLPGFSASNTPGLTVPEMLAVSDLDALWVIGSDALAGGHNSKKAFVVVQDLFLTESAKKADVVLPSASLYEKNGTVTNVCGEVQRVKRAAATLGAKPDLEIIGLIAKELGAAAQLGPWLPDTVYNEIRRTAKAYDIPLPLVTVSAQQTMPVNGRVGVETRPDLIHSAHDGLFTSGTLGRYSKVLNSVIEKRLSYSAAEKEYVAR